MRTLSYNTCMAKPKQTPEERAMRKALKLAEEANARTAYEAERVAADAVYKAGLPKRLMDAQALASSCGVATHVELTANGPSVRFEYEDHSRKSYIDEKLTYQSEEWEVECLEGHLRALKAERDAAAARLVLAQSVFNRLTDEEKVAIKENIAWLRLK